MGLVAARRGVYCEGIPLGGFAVFFLRVLPQRGVVFFEAPGSLKQKERVGSLKGHHFFKPPKGMASQYSLAQRRPFDLLVFPFLSIFSKGPKRLTLYFQVFWASENALAPFGS